MQLQSAVLVVLISRSECVHSLIDFNATKLTPDPIIRNQAILVDHEQHTQKESDNINRLERRQGQGCARCFLGSNDEVDNFSLPQASGSIAAVRSSSFSPPSSSSSTSLRTTGSSPLHTARTPSLVVESSVTISTRFPTRVSTPSRNFHLGTSGTVSFGTSSVASLSTSSIPLSPHTHSSLFADTTESSETSNSDDDYRIGPISDDFDDPSGEDSQRASTNRDEPTIADVIRNTLPPNIRNVRTYSAGETWQGGMDQNFESWWDQMIHYECRPFLEIFDNTFRFRKPVHFISRGYPLTASRKVWFMTFVGENVTLPYFHHAKTWVQLATYDSIRHLTNHWLSWQYAEHPDIPTPWLRTTTYLFSAQVPILTGRPADLEIMVISGTTFDEAWRRSGIPNLPRGKKVSSPWHGVFV